MRLNLIAVLLFSLLALPSFAATERPPGPYHVDPAILSDIDSALQPVSQELSTIDVSKLNVKYAEGKAIQDWLNLAQQNIQTASKAIAVLRLRDSLLHSYLLSFSLSSIQNELEILNQAFASAIISASTVNIEMFTITDIATKIRKIQTPIGQAQQRLVARLLDTFNSADKAFTDCH